MTFLVFNSSDPDLYEKVLYKYNIIRLVKPNSSFITNVAEQYFKNKNIVMLVIESMCIGILMPIHIAKQFKYIANILEYEDYELPIEGGMKVCTICNKWDTHNWSFTKLNRFYNWYGDIEDKSCEELIQNHKEWSGYDIQFIQSMCWENDENILESMNMTNTSNNIVL